MTEPSDSQLSPDIKFQLIKKIERHKVIGIAGLELLEHESKYLEFHRLSGIILFARNIGSMSQLRELIDAVTQRLGEEGRPPLIMADHEGDFVSELRRLIGTPPSAMAIATTGDVDLARDVARATGEAMVKLGVNTVLAPVADLYTNPASPVTGLRTFGRDPAKVGEFVAATIEGYRAAGVLACAKHFPGHGASPGDSHEELPEVTFNVDAERQTQLLPFEAAVAAETDLIMTAHVAYQLGDGHDARVPASFDSRLIRGVLREQLGFGGVVITDALEMEGARAHARETYGGLTGGFERALLAGSDLLLYASPVPERMTIQEDGEPIIAVEVMQTIIETLSKVVDQDRIQRKLEAVAETHEGVRNMLQILNQSEARVNSLRERAAAPSDSQPRNDGNVIHLGDYASTPAIYNTVAERSMVLVRDPESFVPVSPTDQWTLLPIEYRFGASLKGQDIDSMIEGLSRQFPEWSVSGRATGFEADADGVVQPVFDAPERRVILDAQRAAGSATPERLPPGGAIVPLFSSRGLPDDDFLDALRGFVDERQIPFVIITGTPLLDWVPESVGCLATLGASPQVAAAAAAVLAGTLEAAGTLDELV